MLPPKTNIMGVTIEVKKTGWIDVEGKYGYAASGEDLSSAGQTRRLDSGEIKSKVANEQTLATTRIVHQQAQTGK